MKPPAQEHLNGFAKRLQESRAQVGITQMVAAERCLINPVQYSFFEQGRREPNIKNLRKICQGLKVSADHLLGI